MKAQIGALPLQLDPHFSVNFYAELWGLSPSTVLRWFQDRDDVLRVTKPSKNGQRVRVELRIPTSVAQRVYQDHQRTS